MICCFLITEKLLRLTYSDKSFLFALGSPFGFSLYAVLTAPTALCDKDYETYSLFFIGLLHINTD